MIRKWLQKMFGWPCDHEWDELGRGEFKNKYFSGSYSFGLWWLFRCKKCGASKLYRSTQR